MVDPLQSPVRRVLQMLANCEYEELAVLTNGERLSADSMQQAIVGYGRKVIVPPDHVYNELDAIEIRESSPQSWSVRIPLWTEEEGRSDLTVELTITKLPEEFKIEIDDIHVL